MENFLNKWKKWIYVIPFAIFGLIIYMFWARKVDLIKRHLKITTARVYNTGTGYKGQLSVDYVYIINGKQFKSSTALSTSDKNYATFENKFFPLVYDSLDIDNQEILIRPTDFEHYSMKIPDSLVWIKNYYGW